MQQLQILDSCIVADPTLLFEGIEVPLRPGDYNVFANLSDAVPYARVLRSDVATFTRALRVGAFFADFSQIGFCEGRTLHFIQKGLTHLSDEELLHAVYRRFEDTRDFYRVLIADHGDHPVVVCAAPQGDYAVYLLEKDGQTVGLEVCWDEEASPNDG